MKKRIWAVPLMLIASVCIVLLSACGGPSVEELIREDVDKAFSKVTPDDEDLLAAMSDGADGSFEQLGIDYQEFATVYLDGFDYKIKDVVVDEEAGTADATVTVNMKSLSAILTDFTTQFQEYVYSLDPATIGAEKELYAKAGEILMDVVKNAEPAESDCVISYERDGEGVWSSTDDTETEILNAMM